MNVISKNTEPKAVTQFELWKGTGEAVHGEAYGNDGKEGDPGATCHFTSCHVTSSRSVADLVPGSCRPVGSQLVRPWDPHFPWSL